MQASRILVQALTRSAANVSTDSIAALIEEAVDYECTMNGLIFDGNMGGDSTEAAARALVGSTASGSPPPPPLSGVVPAASTTLMPRGMPS